MAFNFFKKKEKEIFENDNTENEKDIVNDFGNFVTHQMSSNINEVNTISAFDNNYNEMIVSDDTNNLNDQSEEPHEERIVTNFNPYENDVPTSNKIESTISTPNSFDNLEPGYNPIMDSLEQIPNSIQDSKDINDVMSNMFKKEEKVDNINQVINNTPVNISNNQSNDVDPGYKRCPKCGQKIREDYQQCFVCGTMLN